MNADKANRWITLGANVGVLIGIILLIVELDQNRDMMRAQTRHDMAVLAIQRNDAAAADPELLDIMQRARAGESLDELENLRYRFRTMATFREWEDVHYQYKLGLFDEEEFAAYSRAWTLMGQGSAGYRRVWCEFRSQTSPDFRAEIDAMFAELGCD